MDEKILSKEKHKKLWTLYIAMIIASLLGIYGQDISYFFYNYIAKVPLEYCITIITLASIFLFVVPPILAFKSYERNKGLDIYYIINLLFGGTISAFSIFVLIMWWG